MSRAPAQPYPVGSIGPRVDHARQVHGRLDGQVTGHEIQHGQAPLPRVGRGGTPGPVADLDSFGQDKYIVAVRRFPIRLAQLRKTV
ncbi:hypothetical protein GCM10010411_13180 [Actinomadura fulvescens]|uniref:Uncharacterized protein n=1 Tax=Actinomadura fulvescens TaxID=46160 RepID=A0ABN3PG27_9ACTN